MATYELPTHDVRRISPSNGADPMGQVVRVFDGLGYQTPFREVDTFVKFATR
jgi:hypothetical protein